MFEQSLLISQGTHVSAAARWTWAGSITLQCCAAALLIAGPLLHPERMVWSPKAPQVFVPLLRPKPIQLQLLRTVAASTSTPQASLPTSGRAITAPSVIPHGIAAGDPPPMSLLGRLGGFDGPLPGALAQVGTGTHVSVAPGVRTEARGPMRVSSGVGAGMLMGPIRPVYPQIAKAAHVQGVVVVDAVISPDGRIERAHVVSGSPMLAGAALEAVEAARYVPFRLNGVAVAVETTVTVNFKIGG